MAVITISRQLGSKGTACARELQRIMQYDFVDRTRLEDMLVTLYGFEQKKFDRYDERKPHFLDSFNPEKDLYLHCLKKAVYEVAKKDNCIIMGRGSQVLLQDVPGVLRVRIIAPEEIRMCRLAETGNYTDSYTRHLIKHSDQDRSGFHRFFFHVNWDDSGLYDLVINTAVCTEHEAAGLIKNALEILHLEEQQEKKNRKLSDLCLSQEVIDRILYKERIFVQLIEVSAADGIVTLRGASFSADNINLCSSIAREVPGVKDVVNEIAYVQTTYGLP